MSKRFVIFVLLKTIFLLIRIETMTDLILQKTKHPKLQDVIKYLLFDNSYNFWGEFLLYLQFIEDNRIPSAGVSIDKKTRRFLFIYNKDFIEKMELSDLAFICIHECLHLTSEHCTRTKLDKYDLQLSNIAQDMIINDAIHRNFVKGQISGFNNHFSISLPEGALLIPEKYQGNKVFEELYEWLKENPDQLPENFQMSSSGSNENGDGEPNEYVFDVHLGIPDEISDEDKKYILEEIITTLKHKGKMTSNIEQMIDMTKMKKPSRNVFNHIKQHLEQAGTGIKELRSYKRLNRRFPGELKGKIGVKRNFNVIIDTSGSMTSDLKEVLPYLLQSCGELTLIQIDTEIKAVQNVKSIERLKLELKGFGGTTLNPALDYIRKNKMQNTPLIILTDGETDTLDYSTICNVTVVSTHIEPPCSNKPINYRYFSIKK
jgi:predicted metal-dependent peptidase